MRYYDPMHIPAISAEPDPAPYAPKAGFDAEYDTADSWDFGEDPMLWARARYDAPAEAEQEQQTITSRVVALVERLVVRLSTLVSPRLAWA